MNGFSKDFLALIGWVGAGVITLVFFPYAASMMEELFRSSRMVNIAAVVLVYLIALSGISVINAMILDNLREFRLGAVDRAFGAVFGLMKGVVIVSVIHFTIVTVAEKEPGWLTDGETYGMTGAGSEIIQDLTKNFVDDGREVIEEQQIDADHF